VLPRLIGGGGHDAALGRVAVASDDDRLALELRTAQHLDSGDELVEVHVQHPSGHALGPTRGRPGQTRPGGNGPQALPDTR
jgi:hypothetical protein